MRRSDMERDCTGVFGKRTFDEQMNDNSNSSTTLILDQNYQVSMPAPYKACVQRKVKRKDFRLFKLNRMDKVHGTDKTLKTVIRHPIKEKED